VPDRPAAFVGYSDVTSLHIWLNLHVGVTSVHGAMVDRRLSRGHDAYDPDTFMRSLGADPIGELAPEGLQVLRSGEASGVLLGGTITQLAASLGTPYAFLPPAGAILFLEDVGERPYRLQRLLMQLRLGDVLSRASAIVLGQMPGCDEPGGALTARAVIEEFFEGFPGPVLFGFPSGHTTTPLISLPFGVEARVVAAGRPRLVLDEAAAI
jgi:muramoyltetrapeptide carboxypeptidase